MNSTKFVISKTTTTLQLHTVIDIIRSFPEVTHARVLPNGRKRASIIVIGGLAIYAETLATVELGSQEPGLPFVGHEISADKAMEIEQITLNSPTQSKKDIEEYIKEDIQQTLDRQAATTKHSLDEHLDRLTEQAHARKVKSKKANAKSKPKPVEVKGTVPGTGRGSGYVETIDNLLFELDGEGKVKGFRRSKHSVRDVVRILADKYPGKNPASIYRVVKVRPRHLERAKTRTFQGGVPRWKFLGPGSGTGMMKRIDELLIEGKLKKAEIAEKVAREFGRDPDMVKRTVQTRPSRLREKNPKWAKLKPAKKAGNKRALNLARNKALMRKAS